MGVPPHIFFSFFRLLFLSLSILGANPPFPFAPALRFMRDPNYLLFDQISLFSVPPNTFFSRLVHLLPLSTHLASACLLTLPSHPEVKFLCRFLLVGRLFFW